MIRPCFLWRCLWIGLGVLASCSKGPTPVAPEALARSAQPEVSLLVTAAATTVSPAPPNHPEPRPAPEPIAPAVVSVPPIEPPAPTNSTPSNKPAQLLKVRWPFGDRYVYRMDLDQHSTNRISGLGKTREEDVTLGITYAIAVMSAREVEVQFLAYDLTIKVDHNVAIAFDSAAPPNSASPDPITAPFTKVTGSKIRLQLDSDGNTDRVVGLDEWLAGLTGSGKEKGPAEELMAQQFNEGFFRQMADFGRGLPAKAVEPGSSWPYRTELPAGGLGKIALDSTITLARWEDHEQRRYAVLESKGSLKQVPGSAPNAAPGALSIASGTVTGKSWFDPEPGILTESVVEQSMRLTGEIPGTPGQASASEQFTSDLGQKITLKMVESTHRP